MKAGLINANCNTLVPNQRSAGVDSVFLFYRHSDEVCEGDYFTLEILIIQGCNASTRIFSQSVDNKWNNPSNWTPVGVHSAYDLAIIPNLNCMIFLNYPDYVIAKSILIEN